MMTNTSRIVNLQQSFGCALEPGVGAHGLGWAHPNDISLHSKPLTLFALVGLNCQLKVRTAAAVTEIGGQ